MPEPAPVTSAQSAVPNKRSAKKQRIRKARVGAPEPLDFDITTKPRSQKLSLIEAAAALRKTPQTMRLWATTRPDHVVKFEKIGGSWLTTIGCVLDFLSRPQQVSRSRKK